MISSLFCFVEKYTTLFGTCGTSSIDHIFYHSSMMTSFCYGERSVLTTRIQGSFNRSCFLIPPRSHRNQWKNRFCKILLFRSSGFFEAALFYHCTVPFSPYEAPDCRCPLQGGLNTASWNHHLESAMTEMQFKYSVEHYRQFSEFLPNFFQSVLKIHLSL